MGGGVGNYNWNIYSGKTSFTFLGGECLQYVPEETYNITITSTLHLQVDYEEADTLIYFHVTSIRAGNISVRASNQMS